MPNDNDTKDTPEYLEEEGPVSPAVQPSKRQRVSLACQRCKGRKQKCNGANPACSSCIRTGSKCVYIHARVSEWKSYIKELEDRVAELESSLSYDGNPGVAADHWERLKPREDIYNSLSGTIRDLSLNASGYYVGATTHISLGRLLGSTLSSIPPVGSSPPSHHHSEPRATQCSRDMPEGPNQRHSRPSSPAGARNPSLIFSNPKIELGFQTYIKHVACQYPVVQSIRLKSLHARREKLSDPWEIAIMHLVYAIGGRSLELMGRSCGFSSHDCYISAMTYRDTILEQKDRRRIIFLALATIYLLRAPSAPGPWFIIDLAMKYCIASGLHRKPSNSHFGLAVELDKRLFWTCYYLDRDIALSTGRPPSISDHDIDIPLPLEIDEDTFALEAFRNAVRQNPELPANPPTSLTDFIHNLRLKRIQSEIQHNIYRVDQTVNPPNDIIDDFLDRLFKWQQASQTIVEPGQMDESSDNHIRRFMKDVYIIHYHITVRLLLFPKLSENPVDSHYLNLCATACAGVCENYKRLHHSSISLLYSPLAIQWLFLSGLTLIYCIWNSPQEILNPSTTSGVYACSTMLYVMTERWPVAHPYRDAFERVRVSVFDLISARAHESRTTIGTVEPATRSALDSLDQIFAKSSVVGVNHMMSSIIGEQVPDISMREADWNLNTDNLGVPVSELMNTYGVTGDVSGNTSDFTQRNYMSISHGTMAKEAYDDVGQGWNSLSIDSGSRDYLFDWPTERVYASSEMQ